MDTLGNKLKKLRDTKGETLKRVAENTDLSPAYISKIEKGDRDPSIKTLEKLANYYNVNLVHILADKQEWYKVLPVELQDFVKQENIEYLEILKSAKDNEISPEAIESIIQTIKKIKR